MRFLRRHAGWALLVAIAVVIGTPTPAPAGVDAGARFSALSSVDPSTIDVTSHPLEIVGDPNGAWAEHQPLEVDCVESVCLIAGTRRDDFSVDGVVIRSTDGGQTWSEALRVGTTSFLDALVCAGPQLCLAGGEVAGDPAIWRSTDLGATWQRSTVEAVAGGIASIGCPTDTSCLAVVGMGSMSIVAATDDAGRTWRYPNKPLNPTTVAVDLPCRPTTACLMVENTRTSDGLELAGATVWDRADSAWGKAGLLANRERIFEVDCTDRLRCAGLVRSGTSTVSTFTSDDGGHSWTGPTGAIEPPSAPTSASLACDPDGRCLAAVTTDAGVVQHLSTDRGTTWSAVPVTGDSADDTAATGPGRFLTIIRENDGRTRTVVHTSLTSASAAPTPPRTPTARGGNGAATISWAPPDAVGDGPVTSYTATATPGGASCTVDVGPTTDASALRCSVPGLVNDTEYRFTVTATNGFGTGPASDPTPAVTPRGTVPAPPTDVLVEVGSEQVTVSWGPPPLDGGSPIETYTVAAAPGTSSCHWVSGPLTCTIVGLEDGATYTVWVTAGNADGESVESAPVSVRPSGVPLTPQSVQAVAGKASATVSWAAPWDRGAPISGYTVTADPGGLQCSTTETACTVPGLTRGVPYTFTVRAMNANGPGPGSEPTTPVVPWTGVGFRPIAPTRILDSRNGTGGWPGALTAGEQRTVAVAGTNGIPATATAIVMNVAVTGADAGSFLTVWPAGQPEPVTANLNFAAGQTTSNLVTVGVGDGGHIALANAIGSTDVVVDVVGYFDDGTAARTGLFTPRAPARVLDSRTTIGGWCTAPLAAGSPRDLTLLLQKGVPIDATAVIANVTVTGSDAASFLTVWPTGQPQPVTANLNFAAGQTVSNLMVLPVGSGGKASFATANGTTHVVVDLVGWYRPSTGNRYHPLAPTRILDDRDGLGLTGPWGPDATRSLPVAGVATIEPDATAVIANLAATGGTAASFLTAWPAGTPRPTAANLLFGPGETTSNLTVLSTGAAGGVDIYNQLGTVHVIADAAGFFAPT